MSDINFAASLREDKDPKLCNFQCPFEIYTSVPAYVGNNYFCESGLHSAWNYQY